MSVWHAFALQQQVPVTHFAGIVSTVVPVQLCFSLTSSCMFQTLSPVKKKKYSLVHINLHNSQQQDIEI